MGPHLQTVDSELLNVLARLMTPFRRYFQQGLDVDRFLADGAYANDIVERLSSADDPRILGAAQFLRGRLSGNLRAPSSSAASLPTPSAPSAPPATSAAAASFPRAEAAPDLPPNPEEQGTKYIKRLR